MAAHATRLAGPIRRPEHRRPHAQGGRVRRALVLLAAFVVVIWSAWGLITSPRLANAAQAVCGSATHADTPDQSGSCVTALYNYGFPE